MFLFSGVFTNFYLPCGNTKLSVGIKCLAMERVKMAIKGNRKFNIRTGLDLVTTPVPDIPYRILGLLRANGGRMSITAQYKSEKSLLAQDLAMRIADGDDWLGFKTISGNVLYVNLEISEEKFQERTQDFYNALKYEGGKLSKFMTVTILDRNLALDLGVVSLQEILDECKATKYKVDVLFLDPRARLITGSENEEVIIKRFCDNVDTLLANTPGLSVVIVTHMGKDPTKGAIGHSRFSGWLDTEIRIVKNTGQKFNKQLEIIGRDVERAVISLNFSYPMHYVVDTEEMARKTKVDVAKEFIASELSHGEETEQQLRVEARKQGITDYAFHTAIRELKDSGEIEAIPAGGQGNRKLLKLTANNTHE